MTAIPACIALLMLLAAGAGPLCFLTAEISLVEALPLAWLLGCSFVSIALALLGIVSSGLVLQMLVTALCLASGVLALRAWRSGRWTLSMPKPSGALQWFLCVVLAIECAFVIRMAWHQSLGWDGLLVWEIKARYAFLNGGVMPARFFSDAMRTWSHPEYPLLFPLVETWLYLWIGDCDQSWVRVLFPCFYFACIMLLGSAAFRFSGKKCVGLVAAGLLFCVPYVLAGQGGVLAGYADFPLAVFYLAAFVHYLGYVRENTLGSMALFAFFAGMLPWMKNDGVILWACLMAISITDLARRRNFRMALVAPLPGVIAFIGWKIALAILKNPGDSNFIPVTAASLRSHLHRLGPIVHELFRELTNLHGWSILWPVFVFAIVCLAAKGRAALAARLFLAVFVPLALYACTYIFSAWPYYLNHVHLSLPRLVLQVTPVAVLAAALAFGAETSVKNTPVPNSR